MASRAGPKCGGKLHGRDGTCTLPAGWGTEHKGWGRCRKHLGTTPTVAKAAETERVEHEVRAMLVQFGIQPVDDPLREIEMLAGEMKVFKEAAGQKVNALAELRYKDAKGAEQIRAEVIIYERAVDRYQRILVDMARLGLDERMLRIREGQGKIIVAAVAAGLADVDIPGELQQEIRAAIARRLQAAAVQERQRDRIALEPVR